MSELICYIRPEGGMGSLSRDLGESCEVPEQLVRDQLDRVLASGVFARSKRLAEFLRFIVEETLAGRGNTLKENVLAARLYPRASTSSGDDSVVRVDARRLRDKLREFYAESHVERVIISLPKGNYVPAFALCAQTRQQPAGSQRFPRALRRRVVAGAIAIPVLAGLTIFAIGKVRRRGTQPASTLSIAVLPFRDLTASRDQEAFCLAITEELTVRLTSIGGVRVAGRTSVAPYKGVPVDAGRVGKDLNVQAVMDGSVRIEGSRVRVIAELFDTRDGFHLWNHTFESEAGAGIEQRAAEVIFRAFRKELKTTTRALVRPPSGNREAWHRYIRAAYLMRRQPLRAVEHYRAAVAADSRYALAWAGLSLAATLAVDWGEGESGNLLAKAQDAARRAVSLEPSLPEAHHAIARVKAFADYDWTGSERAFRRAIELDPTYHDARLHYAATVLIPNSRFGEAVEELQRALALYPENNQLLNQLANTYIKARQYDKAIPLLEASERIQPGQLAALVYSGMIADQNGEYQRAIELLEQAASVNRTPWVLSHIGHVYAKLGRKDAARRIIAELVRTTPGSPAYDYEMATIYAALGDRDAAFAGLNRSLASHSPNIAWLEVDHLLDGVREDARFLQLLKTLKLR